MSLQFPFDREVPCNNRWKDLPICGRSSTRIIFKENTQEVIKSRCEMCSNDERFKELEHRVKLLEENAPKVTILNTKWIEDMKDQK